MRSPVTPLLVVLLLGGASPMVAQKLLRPGDPPLVWRTPAECAGVTAPPNATNDTPGFTPARPFAVIPSLDSPRALRGKVVEVRMLIGSLGTLDSVEVGGLTDEKFKARYIKSLKEVAPKSNLRPAYYQGCAVASWWSYTMRMGEG